MFLEVDWHRGKGHDCYASTNAIWSQAEFRRPYRSNADRLEQLIIASVSAFLSDRKKLRAALKGLGLYGDELDRQAEKGRAAASFLDETPPEQREELFAALLIRVEIGEDHVSVFYRSIELRRFLSWDGKTPFRGRPADWSVSDAPVGE